MNTTENVTQLMPQKVLNLAYDLGAHGDCVEADLVGACSMCTSIFHQAFDHFYGHLKNADDALMMIINDILKDRTDLNV